MQIAHIQAELNDEDVALPMKIRRDIEIQIEDLVRRWLAESVGGQEIRGPSSSAAS